MSLLINKELIWVSIPRIASTSIENGFIDSNLEIEHIDFPNFRNIFNTGYFNEKPYHTHYKLSDLKKHFGNKESFCIRRDWFERWISALSHFWDLAQDKNSETIIRYSQIDNDFIYNMFNKEFSNTLLTKGGLAICTSKLIKNSHLLNRKFQNISHLFLSQYYWTDNTKCDYEFDIYDIQKVKNFIENRFNSQIEFSHINNSIKKESKIIIDDKLKNHIWETFEKPFYKSKKTII